MNFGLRCAQMMCERHDLRRMNIASRTELWYRLERIGKREAEPLQEPKIIFKRRPVDDEINQLKGQVLFLRNKVNELTARQKPKQVKSKYPGLKL